ncbi:hypothetical protein D3C77_372840 [compost metagenome]
MIADVRCCASPESATYTPAHTTTAARTIPGGRKRSGELLGNVVDLLRIGRHQIRHALQIFLIRVECVRVLLNVFRDQLLQLLHASGKAVLRQITSDRLFNDVVIFLFISIHRKQLGDERPISQCPLGRLVDQQRCTGMSRYCICRWIPVDFRTFFCLAGLKLRRSSGVIACIFACTSV